MKRIARLGIIGLMAGLPLAQADAYQVIISPTSGLVTTEDGGSDQFTAVLDAAPTAVVTMGISSSNSDEGSASTRQLIFTPSDWNQPQTVTVTGASDQAGDGDQGYSIITDSTVSDDANFDGLNPSDVSVTNIDTTEHFIISAISGDTSEGGASATFTVALGFAPTMDVVIPLRSSDETEGRISVDQLTFTADNWATPQTVTVVGVADAEHDGGQSYTIQLGVATSGDASFTGVDPADVSLTNADTTRLLVVASTVSGPTTELGGEATFTVVLTEAPSASVTIPVSSSDTGEGVVGVDSLTFTRGDWDVPQTVTVTGVSDSEADGDQAYTVHLGAVVSQDASYSGVDPSDVAVVNAEHARARVVVSAVSGATSEGGDVATFTVALSAAPLSDVVLTVRSSDPGEGTASPVMLIFTSGNWSEPQVVTVTGALDLLDDGDQAYLVEFGDASSTDPAFDGISTSSVALINQDLQVVTDRVVGSEEQLDGLLLRGSVVNQGRLSNVRLLGGGTVEGGTLSGTISNAGTVRNVTLASGSSVEGGVVGGRVSGSTEVGAVAPVINATVESGAELSNVTIGEAAQLESGVILGRGVLFAANEQIPEGLDLSGPLPSIGGGALYPQPVPDLSGDVVVAGASGADPILFSLNTLPGLADAGLLLTQDGQSGSLRIGGNGDHFMVRPTAVVQAASGTPAGVSADRTSRFQAVTADGRQVTLDPVLEAPEAFTAAAELLWSHTPIAYDGGALTIVIDDTRRLVLRPAITVSVASRGLADGVHWVEHPEYPLVSVPLHVFTDTSGQQWEQLLYPFASAALLDAVVAIPDIDSAYVGEDGRLWVFTTDGEELHGLLGVEVVSGEPSVLGVIGFLPEADLNGDGTGDVTIIDGNGDRQTLYILP